MVALPFFALLFAIFDLALIFLGTSQLDNGLTAAARQIRTGQVQADGLTAAEFRQMVCDRITPLLACDDKLVIDVRRFGSFGGVVTPPPLDAGGRRRHHRRAGLLRLAHHFAVQLHLREHERGRPHAFGGDRLPQRTILGTRRGHDRILQTISFCSQRRQRH